MSETATFLYAGFGGLAAEVAVIFALRQRFPDEAPHYLRSVLYYLISVAMAASGGVVALAYAGSGTSLNPILAIQIGASAPLLLRKLSETMVEPPKPPKIPLDARVN